MIHAATTVCHLPTYQSLYCYFTYTPVLFYSYASLWLCSGADSSPVPHPAAPPSRVSPAQPSSQDLPNPALPKAASHGPSSAAAKCPVQPQPAGVVPGMPADLCDCHCTLSSSCTSKRHFCRRWCIMTALTAHIV